MLYQQLLHDFVDGTLDFPEETALFSELHSNDSLRSELKMLILMGRSVAHDIDAFIPAPESRQAIFARLGFASETAAGGALRGGLLHGSLQGVAGGIVGALLTALVILGFDLRVAPAIRQNDAATTRTTASAPAAADPQARLDGTPGHNGATSYNGTATPASGSGVALPPAATALSSVSQPGASPHVMMPARQNPRGTLQARKPLASLPSAPAISPVNLRAFALLPAGSAKETDAHSSNNALPFPVTSPSLESRGLTLPPVSIGYRALTARSFVTPPAALTNQSDALLRDKSLEIGYRLDATRTIAVEMGQEEFYQRFEEQLENGDFVRHEQNPVLLWGGASYRQSFPLGSNLNPFVGILAGGTRFGPIGRLSVGTSYTLVPEIDLFAGAELSALAYSLDNRWYFTPRYGMTYGLRVNF